MKLQAPTYTYMCVCTFKISTLALRTLYDKANKGIYNSKLKNSLFIKGSFLFLFKSLLGSITVSRREASLRNG